MNKQTMLPRSIALRRDQLVALDRISKECGLPMSWLVRRGVDAIIDGQVGILSGGKGGAYGSVGRVGASRRRDGRSR